MEIAWAKCGTMANIAKSVADTGDITLARTIANATEAKAASAAGPWREVNTLRHLANALTQIGDSLRAGQVTAIADELDGSTTHIRWSSDGIQIRNFDAYVADGDLDGAEYLATSAAVPSWLRSRMRLVLDDIDTTGTQPRPRNLAEVIETDLPTADVASDTAEIQQDGVTPYVLGCAWHQGNSAKPLHSLAVNDPKTLQMLADEVIGDARYRERTRLPRTLLARLRGIVSKYVR